MHLNTKNTHRKCNEHRNYLGTSCVATHDIALVKIILNVLNGETPI